MTISIPIRTLRVRRPADLVACALVTLGFQPQDSLVMLTFARHRTFHARVDLPSLPPETVDGDRRRAADCRALAEAMVAPAVQHRVEQVALLHYTADAERCRLLADVLDDAFEHVGIEIVEQARVHDGRLYPLGAPRPDLPAEGVDADPWSHAFTADSVVAGTPVLASREQLTARVALDVSAARAVLRAATARPVEDPPPGPAQVRSRVRGWIAAGAVPDDAELVDLLRVLADPALRAAAWCPESREQAGAHVELWAAILRRTPTRWVIGPATLLALAAAHRGEGALAWCALDRATDDAPGAAAADPWVGLITESLVAALPPEHYAPAPLPPE